MLLAMLDVSAATPTADTDRAPGGLNGTLVTVINDGAR